jgi:hypothetical protein
MDHLQFAVATYRPDTTLALSALPNAPVVADVATTTQRTRLSMAAALRRVADTIAPTGTPASAVPCN